MLNLNLATGGRLEIPGYALLSVMKPADETAPSSVMYDVGAGLKVDQLADQYGYVRKLAIDADAFVNGLSVDIIERHEIVGDDGETKIEALAGAMMLSRNSIIARRDTPDGADGVRAELTVRFGQDITATIQVTQSLDELDGITS